MKKQVDIETEKKAIQEPSLAQDIIQLLLKIVIIIFAIILIFTLLYGIARINDVSMKPAIKDGDLVMYYRLDKRFVSGDVAVFEDNGISIEHMPSGIDTMTIFVHQDEFAEREQKVIAGIHRAVEPDFLELESDLALIAVVGRGMRATRGTSGRIFSALAHANVNVKMIDQGFSELNIIIGVRNHDFDAAIKAIYDIFVNTRI